ncbi:MAG: AAA family ATPase [Lachnospiraceae bacterium]
MTHVVITIARQYGSGGKTIGEMLAKELDIPCYNREILRMASEESGISEQLFGQIDEKLNVGILHKLVKKAYDGELIQPEEEGFVSQDNLFNYQAKIIKELARQESCVIIGRCADYVLRDNENVARIFIHADEEFCMARALERNSLSAKDMKKYIARTDKYRAVFYKYYTGNEWSDARNFDLCINSGRLGFERSVEEIRSYLGIRFGKKF